MIEIISEIYNFFNTLPHETRLSVSVIIAIGFILHIIFDKKAVTFGPTILTTLGIFFTFLGIAVGLKNFNAQDIKNSVPELLDGLKTAFWASVFGVGIALTIKVRDYIWGAKINQSGASEATINDLNKNLSLILSGLSSPDGESLVSQIKLLRQDINDKLEKLRVSQEKSLEALAQMGSKALIEALEEVIREFNEKLTTQFGENFKKLNDAVHKMVEWQENYRSHVEIVEQAINSATASIKSAVENSEAILARAENFSTTSEKLASIIDAMDRQLSTISENMVTLKSILESASDSIPALKLKTEEFAKEMMSSISTATNEVKNTSDLAIKDIQTANSEMTKATTELANQIRAQSTALEKEIEKALTTSITTLGQQLGALSEKFVNDYQPITRSIRELLVAVERGSKN